MAISIKSSPVLTGITAKRFDALVEQNKSIDARTLSETEKKLKELYKSFVIRMKEKSESK